jgi:putative lipoic acid-binding regulatory protein
MLDWLIKFLGGITRTEFDFYVVSQGDVNNELYRKINYLETKVIQLTVDKMAPETLASVSEVKPVRPMRGSWVSKRAQLEKQDREQLPVDYKKTAEADQTEDYWKSKGGQQVG